MAKATLQELSEKLFSESDGSKFSKIKDNLIRNFGTTDTAQVFDVFTRYAREGKLLHWRNFLMTDIIRMIPEDTIQYAPFFEWSITIPELTYWGIDGLLKVNGRNAYHSLVAIAANEQLQLSVRAKAIKSLAMHSQQPFDRQLPADPGYWKVMDLRLSEVMEWEKNGYPDGGGYAAPVTHPALEHPSSRLEQVVAGLERKLKQRRNNSQDLSNPADWLVIANSSDMNAIDGKWALPETYRTFLQNFSPLRVMIDGGEVFPGGLDLYGAAELIERQNGYAYDAVRQEEIADWPAHLVVIADAGGDPFCIDLNSKEGAVYSSMHGMGRWDFELYTDNFIDFLEEVAESE